MYTHMMQHPVGRGGLFSGYVDTGYRSLRWIYDCGSFNRQNELISEISRVRYSGDVDILFISHLDNDHVSGIDELLQQFNNVGRPIRTVMLPYLDHDISLGIMAKSGANSPLSSVFIQMNQNTREWFISRGVKRIIYVDSNDDEDFVRSIDEFEEGDDSQVQEIRLGRSIFAFDQEISDDIDFPTEFDTDVSVVISGKSSKNSFVLIPYTYRPKSHLFEKFKDELKKVFGSATFETITSAAKEDAGRKKLRRCYDKIWKTHNLVSMSLYCGPVFKSASKSLALCGDDFHQMTDHGGWMLTGDSNLSGKDRFDKFLRYYSHYIPNVSIFMLPHHGSCGSYHAAIPCSFESVRLFYATANRGDRFFPHNRVRHFLKVSNRGCGYEYQTVETDQHSKIILMGDVS